jgi:hypothetical protein
MEKEILIFGDKKSVGAFLEDYYGFRFRHDRLIVVAVVLIAYPIIYASLFAYCITYIFVLFLVVNDVDCVILLCFLGFDLKLFIVLIGFDLL